MEKELNFDEFKGKSKEDWVKKVIADLKGKSYESLAFNTDDNLVFEPFYTKDKLIDQEFSFFAFLLGYSTRF